MNCSISGKVPEEPVVLKNSGYLFEKRLIERHISYFGKCPVTGEPLTFDDIVSVKTGKIVKPRLVQASSIPRTSGVIRHKSGMWNIMNDPEVKKFRERLLGFRYQSMLPHNGFTNCFPGNNGDSLSRFYNIRDVVWRPQNEDLNRGGKKELEDFIRVRQKEIEELWELKRQEKRENELKKKRKELKKLKREKKLKKAKMAETTNVDADGCPLKKLKLNVVEDDLANVEEVKLDVSASEDADQPREVVLLDELAGNLMEEGLKLCAREAEKKNAAAAAAAYSKTG